MKRLLAVAIFIAAAADARVITEKDLFRFQWIADPQLSTDGSQIAFVRVTVDEKKDRYDTSIWTVPAAGGTQRQITTGTNDTAPRWSPNGNSLAFLRSLEKDGKPQPAQIYILPLDGGEPRPVTSLARAIDSIAWSPSGRTIAFTARTKPEDVEEKKKSEEHVSDVRVINQAIYRFNGPGYLDVTRAAHIWTLEVPATSADEAPKPKQLTTGDFSEGEPVWSPEGSRIYFTSNRVYEPYYDRQDANIYAIPAAGGEMVKVADIDGTAGDASPSPDGKWIAFRGTLSNPVHSYEQSDLFVVGSSGGEARNLTASFDSDVLSGLTGDQAAPRAARGARPTWSGDSKTIYITAAEEGKVNLKRID
ncbi:MAG TPA: S9 family peptidase, partial [Thermoanaerobaculia bacterium]